MPLNFGKLSSASETLIMGLPDLMFELFPIPDLSHIEDPLEYRRALKALAFVSGKTFMDLRHYTSEGECLKCPNCGAAPQDFRKIAEDFATEGIVAEERTYCKNCNADVAFWSYGSYDASFAFIDGDTHVPEAPNRT